MNRAFVLFLALSAAACGSDANQNPGAPCGQALCAAAGAGGSGTGGSGAQAGSGTGGSGAQAGSGAGGAGAQAGGGAAGAAAGCDPATQPCGDALRVDSAWAAGHLGDPSVAFVDVRPLADYDTERLPGASHVDVGAVRATVDGISGQVAPLGTVEAVLGSAGLLPSDSLVIYGDTTDTTPARLVWTLHYYGHADARLLDGGFSAYAASGAATETSTPSVGPESYSAAGVVAALRVEADWIAARLDDPSVVLVDARSASEFAAGHIPGAINVDWQTNVQAGALKPKSEVEALYAGIDRKATVVAYCQTGSRASVAYFVLQWLGFADVRLYDGSWAEWGGRSDLPKQTG